MGRTCKSSFDFIKVGDGYTAQVNKIEHKYAKNFSNVLSYRISEMCIQVRGKDAFGNNLTKEKAAELTAFAIDNARLELFKEINVSIFNSIQAKNEYKFYVQEELSKLTGGKATSSISYGHCFGDIPIRTYTVSPLNILPCVNSW